MRHTGELVPLLTSASNHGLRFFKSNLVGRNGEREDEGLQSLSLLTLCGKGRVCSVFGLFCSFLAGVLRQSVSFCVHQRVS